MPHYAGIGSRGTPLEVLAYMQRIAGRLAARGYALRSGAADGADAAFEAGCTAANGRAEIWLPWKGFNQHADTGFYPGTQHFELAQTIHPAWDRLTRGPRALHARNVGQVLGADCRTPVSFVLCWTPDGCETEAARTRETGGTGTAIVLAARSGLPVFNLAKADAVERLTRHVLAECAGRLPPAISPTRVGHIQEETCDVYIGRAHPTAGLPESVWHNPFRIGTDGTREEVVAKYHTYLLARPDLLARLPELRGKLLGCWCKSRAAPDTLCHGDVLAALSDGREWVAPQPAQGALF